MGFTVGKFRTGQKVSITDGRQQVQFDTPADFSDWQEDHYGEDLSKWQWTLAEPAGGS